MTQFHGKFAITFIQTHLFQVYYRSEVIRGLEIQEPICCDVSILYAQICLINHVFRRRL